MDHRNPASWTPEFAQEVHRTRELVADLHAELPRWELVVWTAGNVSQRIRGEAADGSQDLLVIKPSGVSYDDLSAEAMVVCDLNGELIQGEGKPSSDTAAHAYVYRHMPHIGGVVHTHSTYATAWAALGEPIPCVITAMADEFGGEIEGKPSSDTAAHAYVYRHMPHIGGVVHTHSTYATAWAARGEAIPCVLTMMGDEFGGDIPVGPFALIGDDSIGKGIVDTLKDHPSPAVLMQNHGPFTIGKDARAAVKAAVMVEEVARTVHIARQGGDLIPIPQEAIESLYARYQNVYGQ